MNIFENFKSYSQKKLAIQCPRTYSVEKLIGLKVPSSHTYMLWMDKLEGVLHYQTLHFLSFYWLHMAGGSRWEIEHLFDMTRLSTSYLENSSKIVYGMQLTCSVLLGAIMEGRRLPPFVDCKGVTQFRIEYSPSIVYATQTSARADVAKSFKV